ncbi:MAG: hypothetical protein OXN21_14480, partial [Chloroflexota bacterium]|nr:hypothetical protein [Chloroflexota bacterium]
MPRSTMSTQRRLEEVVMAIPVEHSSVSTMDQQVTHPLDPLTSEEIVLAASILREQRQLGPRVRFETIVLNEPDKAVAAGFSPGDPLLREAFLVILDNEDASTWEAVVSLNEGKVTSWKHVPGVQPRIMFDEFAECEATVRADPRFQAALRKRGITDPDLVMVDPWSAGYYGYEDEEGRRLALARNFLRSSPTDNGYARPIEGLSALVDLNKMEIMRIDDYGVIPLPPNPGNYSAEFVDADALADQVLGPLYACGRARDDCARDGQGLLGGVVGGGDPGDRESLVVGDDGGEGVGEGGVGRPAPDGRQGAGPALGPDQFHL